MIPDNKYILQILPVVTGFARRLGGVFSSSLKNAGAAEFQSFPFMNLKQVQATTTYFRKSHHRMKEKNCSQEDKSWASYCVEEKRVESAQVGVFSS